MNTPGFDSRAPVRFIPKDFLTILRALFAYMPDNLVQEHSPGYAPGVEVLLWGCSPLEDHSWCALHRVQRKCVAAAQCHGGQERMQEQTYEHRAWKTAV